MDRFDDDFRFHEIKEVPIIIDNLGNVVACGDQLLRFSRQALEQMAEYAETDIDYFKFRCTYTVPEQIICTYRNCSRPAVKGTLRCDNPKHAKKPKTSPFE